MGDFNLQKLPSRRLQTLWEQKNRVHLEKYYIFDVAIPRDVSEACQSLLGGCLGAEHRQHSHRTSKVERVPLASTQVTFYSQHRPKTANYSTCSSLDKNVGLSQNHRTQDLARSSRSPPSASRNGAVRLVPSSSCQKVTG